MIPNEHTTYFCKNRVSILSGYNFSRICLVPACVSVLLVGCLKGPDNPLSTEDLLGIPNITVGAGAYFGGKIVFSSNRNGNDDIFITSLPHGRLHIITRDPATDCNPSWSPDGSRIVFASDRDGMQHIYVMNEDRSNLVQLTRTREYDRTPSWSPDGTKIVYRSQRDGNGEIYIMN